MSPSRSRVFITGSADGLGLAAARDLLARGHDVVLHARNDRRADDVRRLLPDAAGVVVADVTSLDAVRQLADDAQRFGPIDTVIHNVGLGYREPRRDDTVDGHSRLLQVNVLTPYVLSALMPHPERVIWLSSGLHRSGDADLDDVDWVGRRWNGFQAYCDSKLFDAALSAAVARSWPDVVSHAVEPGWVPTRMGGPGATDDLSLGHVTQVWLADGQDPRTQVSGGYWFHQGPCRTHPAVDDPVFQDRLLEVLHELTGVELAATAAPA